jgi:hypothetical protein
MCEGLLLVTSARLARVPATLVAAVGTREGCSSFHSNVRGVLPGAPRACTLSC